MGAHLYIYSLVRSRSEPCLSYIISRRSKPVFGGSSSRCLSPLTPRRLHPSPRHLAAQALKNVSSVNSNRRWSYASLPSHPSSGYMTQNSTPPSHSACSSSAEKIYRSDVESIEGWYFYRPAFYVFIIVQIYENVPHYQQVFHRINWKLKNEKLKIVILFTEKNSQKSENKWSQNYQNLFGMKKWLRRN